LRIAAEQKLQEKIEQVRQLHTHSITWMCHYKQILWPVGKGTERFARWNQRPRTP
jgi:hypothetical protein